MSTHEHAIAEHVSANEEVDASREGFGTGNAATAPHEPVPVGILAAQPAAIIGTIVAVADAILVAAVPLPEWATSLLVAVVTIAGMLGIRSKVTPVARPRLDADTPLTP